MTRPALFAVTGRPILHSLSPVVFTAAFEAAGVDAIYTRLAADGAREALGLARALGLTGMNVTSPLKERIVPLLDHVEPSAEAIGAANTVVLRDGEAVGHNTDPVGVRAMLEATGSPLAGKRAVVLGAGGAARAAVYAIAEAGPADVVVVNRTEERARALAEQFGVRAAPWEAAADELARADLVFSCLPTVVAPVSPDWLRPGQFLLDANYKSPQLAEVAMRAGCAYIGGREWLLGQAVAAFEAFTGREAPAAVMKRTLAHTGLRARPSRIALTGMMGSGKSTSAGLLAAELGRRLLDTDALVERHASAPVAELFRDWGEPAFRQLENSAVREALDAREVVVALGGGALLDPSARELVRRRALVVWLWADAQTCFDRARGDTRPLLAGGDPAGEMSRLLDRRRADYARSADLVVDAASRTARDVAAKIAAELRLTWP